MQMNYGIVLTEPVVIGLYQSGADLGQPFPDRVTAEIVEDRAGNPVARKLLKLVPGAGKCEAQEHAHNAVIVVLERGLKALAGGKRQGRKGSMTGGRSNRTWAGVDDLNVGESRVPPVRDGRSESLISSAMSYKFKTTIEP